MNKEQAKLKLETDIINYENQIKFLDPSSMYTRWIIDAKIFAELALEELKETGEHNYKDVEWEEKYAKIFTDKELYTSSESTRRTANDVNNKVSYIYNVSKETDYKGLIF